MTTVTSASEKSNEQIGHAAHEADIRALATRYHSSVPDYLEDARRAFLGALCLESKEGGAKDTNAVEGVNELFLLFSLLSRIFSQGSIRNNTKSSSTVPQHRDPAKR